MPLSVREIVSLSEHRTYPDTGTVHDQFEVRKVWSRVTINYLELGSLYMVNCFFTAWNLRRRPSFFKYKFRRVCLTCEMRCQHESTDSIVKTKSSSYRTICGVRGINQRIFVHNCFSTDSKILDLVYMTNWSAILMTYSKWHCSIQTNWLPDATILSLLCNFYLIWYQILSWSNFWKQEFDEF